MTGCDQNLSTTLYMRDVNDLLASTEAKSLPIDIEIEILEMGITKQCSKPEGMKLVEAVASVFEKAALVGCEKVSGSMNDKMVIKATTVVSLALTNDVVPGPYLVHFDIQKTEETSRAFVLARFNSEKYAYLQDELKRLSPMGGIKIDDARISVAINNDERNPVSVYPHSGTFANGDPVDANYEEKLEPRQEIALKFGDVKMAFLAKTGWAGIANVRTEVAVQ
ncbi:hypothetical protein ASD02_35355 [Ensifer sp. Root1252]|nr:hypothetical protein ASD02_35355 [Ensifer sp. Root1252]KRC67098.1 hypothetical protein ASE32_35585 [Ensifer sp. Root231]KRC93677.1 hypothetical protein ASE47_35440 [Ensifer sp. Root258]